VSDIKEKQTSTKKIHGLPVQNNEVEIKIALKNT